MSRAIRVRTGVGGRSDSRRLDLERGARICDRAEAADARLVPGRCACGNLKRGGGPGAAEDVAVL